jgi:hypothetical protein
MKGNMIGQLDVLNCGEGHLEIKFNERDVIETERAKRIIQDMLKRGYALFIHGKDNALIRVKKFVPKSGCYIIADGPTIPPEAIPTSESQERGVRSVKMGKCKATVVGRSAGG